MTKYSYSPADEKLINKPYVLNDINLEYTLTSGNYDCRDNGVIDAMTYNILFTVPGEIPFEPEFGSDVIYFLHQKISSVNAWRIENEITTALTRWHPHIVVIRQKIEVVANFDTGSYYLTIPYSPRSNSNLFVQQSLFEADLFTVGN